MGRITPVRKPHTSTEDLPDWSETPPSDSPSQGSAARAQPSDGIRKVTDEEAEGLNKSYFWCWCYKNSPKFGSLSDENVLCEHASAVLVRFSSVELQHLTLVSIGKGEFGDVYRGVLQNGKVVAVKRKKRIWHDDKQFWTEVATACMTHHLNLVRLVGFCSEERHKLLVYELMENGSLYDFLFATKEQSQNFLNWKCRFNIALGTARGITYLHEECIAHCDIKPENILLDGKYTAKVSDFGLAHFINPKDRRYQTLVCRDVWKYGMVLLDIVSGRRNFDVSPETNGKKFSLWAYEEFRKGNVEGIVDRRLADQDVDMEQARRAIYVSFLCIQEQASQRPMMGKVVQMLEGIMVEGIMEIEMLPAPMPFLEEGSVWWSEHQYEQ